MCLSHTLQMCSIAVPGMKARKRGAIVNVGSGSATFLPSYPLYAVYGATKVGQWRQNDQCLIPSPSCQCTSNSVWPHSPLRQHQQTAEADRSSCSGCAQPNVDIISAELSADYCVSRLYAAPTWSPPIDTFAFAI
jgi:hypothetical protein